MCGPEISKIKTLNKKAVSTITPKVHHCEKLIEEDFNKYFLFNLYYIKNQFIIINVEDGIDWIGRFDNEQVSICCYNF